MAATLGPRSASAPQIRGAPEIRDRPPRLAWFRPGLLAVCAFTLMVATVNYATDRLEGREVTWLGSVAVELPVWPGWFLLSPGIVAVARAFPLRQRRWPLALLVHLATCAFATFLSVAAVLSFRALLPSTRPPVPLAGSTLWTSFLATIPLGVLIYGGIVAALEAASIALRLRETEIEASRLEARLATAELSRLRAQLAPHFLFNALNGISGLMVRDVPAARRMLRALADLLRESLTGGARQEVPLAEELDLLQRYLDLLAMRFGDRLRVVLAPEPATLRLLAPRLIFQPLVENAVRHGLEPRAAGGRLAVATARRGAVLELSVEDDGIGLARGGPLREGLGLSITRARLAELYGKAGELTIEPLAAGGTRVVIALPARAASETGT